MKSYLIILYIVSALAAVSATDYCSITCQGVHNNKRLEHIGCNPKNSFGPECPPNAEMVHLDESLQQVLTHNHNIVRNSVAGGTNPKYKAACRMATMQWDPELAELAVLNVKKCEIEEDFCHVTDAVKKSGQNLHMSRRDLNYGNITEVLVSTVKVWFSIVDEKGYDNNIIADRNIRLGCAVSSYSDHDTKWFLTTCNYASDIKDDSPVYTKCASAGEKCRQRSRMYPNLCEVGERYEE